MENNYTDIPKNPNYEKLDKIDPEIYTKIHDKMLKSSEFESLACDKPEAASFFKEGKYKELRPICNKNRYGYFNEYGQIDKEITQQEFNLWVKAYYSCYSLIAKEWEEINKMLKSPKHEGEITK